MAELTVRNVEEKIVRELEIRAARNGQSAEEELRQILRQALVSEGSDSSSLKEILSAMPDVGDDEDFERIQDRGRAVAL